MERLEKDKKLSKEEKDFLSDLWYEQSSMALHGYVRSYGAYDYYEDIATFVEKIVTNPMFFNNLIDPSSEKYDPRYQLKIDLLLAYGFIDKYQYENVVPRQENIATLITAETK
ncbi:hypothetical protein A3J90_03600 [candidate division WOR-1 bacterium RIFOXYC2_FULL_37_10]|uniref:Uncharacterized protein n=1 Tax=candidate division WOR-1 bacterium RIFOXYB2_FULL_37_13 TaxID=1802579 RepID=A0A1F4SE87_UNCSA|nr:MAG: hypothetical protein A2246_01365 [candidate division WOR-1 bacterium RIFOXYA2_FULL_37_7]OGC18748.1 MAG: hypothetical protein A2310_02530 [candidate division WOR-1 bacterium RIFOXYB2_FULL_37_13]OGC32649.1 MAG: hypothetical protein A3J90_03600 [candidate division WOR-1 bacterium RIFOXYC2_FULL_37_10]